MAAQKAQLKDPTTGEKIYPVTSSACVGMSNGSGNLDKKLTELDSNINVNLNRLSSMFGSYWNGELLESVEVIKKFYIQNSNGEQKTEPEPTNGSCTDFIPVKGSTLYTYFGGLKDARGIAAYDENKSFIMGLSDNTKGEIVRILDFITPANAKYIRCSVYRNNDSYLVYENGVDFTKRLDYLFSMSGTLSSKILPCVGDKVDLSEVTPKNGYYISKNGTEYSFSNSQIWDILTLRAETLYMFVDGALGELRAIVFYDSDDNIIDAYNGYDLNIRSATAYTGKRTFSLMTPKNLHKTRLSWGNLEAPYIVEVMNVNYMQTYMRIDELKNSLNTLQKTVSESIQDINNKIGDFKVSEEEIPQAEFGEDTYFINSSGNPQQGLHGDKYTDYIPVEGNSYYEYNGYFTDSRAYAEYDESKVFVKALTAKQIDTSGKVSKYHFKTHPNTKYVRFSVYQVESYTLKKVSATINDLLLDITNSIVDIYSKIEETQNDYECTFPSYLFAIDNDSSDFYAREYVQYLFPESFLKNSADLNVNGATYYPVQSREKNTNNIEKSQHDITLSGDGYKTKKQSVKLIKVKASVAKNKQIRYLAIGDSITANQKPNMSGQFVGGWCYPSVAKEILLKDNKDFGDNSLDMLLIGTTNFKETYFDYKEEKIKLRGFSEGRGSWTTANYLRHATSICAKGNVSGDNSVQTHAETSWLLLGLETKQPIDGVYNPEAEKETWIGSSEQDNLIRTTPTGKYHWDYGANLWNWCKKRNSELQGEYTGSEEQKQQIDTVINALLDNPTNPFFDKDIAKEHDYAFSLSTYINRYKTLQDDGKTRLIVGSTAGAKITNKNINSIDVCTPTHVTIELGENERWWYTVTAEQTCDDIEKLYEIINTEYPDIKIGFVNPRYLGVFYPEKWFDMGICGVMSVAGNTFKYDMNKIMQERLGSLDTQTKNYFLPCYYVQSPLYREKTRYDISLLNNKEVILGGTDNNHPGLLSYWSMAYQVLSWIYYTLGKTV